MNINIYHQFDPDTSASGGIGKFVLNLIKELPNDWNVTLICCSNKQAGTTDSVEMFGKTIKRVFVLALKDENKRSLFPITISYLFGLLKYRSLIPIADVQFIQRLEYAIFTCSFLNKSKNCFLFHNDYEHILDQSKSESYWARFPTIYMKLAGYFIRKLDLTLSVNTNTKKLFDRYMCKDFVHVIPTWPDRDKFYILSEDESHIDVVHFTEKFRINKNKKNILFVGRLQNQKNPLLALSFIQRISDDYHLIIAGDGNMRDELERYCSENNLQGKVEFLGNVSQTELLSLYNSCYMYLSTSHFEGMSVALLEALACGLPAITTPTGEARSIISTGLNGVLTTDFNVDSLLNALEVFERHKYKKSIVAASISKFDATDLIQKLKGLA